MPPMMEDDNFNPHDRCGGGAGVPDEGRQADESDSPAPGGATNADSRSGGGEAPARPPSGDPPGKPAGAPPSDDDWDESQLAVIQSDYDARIVVDSGPGRGKTAVACKRLAYLIDEEDLEPSNIVMISFTRAAVAEFRNRLYSYVGPSAHSVKIGTIDSRAWSIHSGHVANSRLTGSYEENIQKTIRLLESQSDEVKHELSQIQHVVIDEAQDIVGVRADLVCGLVDMMSPECGVTVFADKAQAIYGFADDEDQRRVATSLRGNKQLLEWLEEADGPNFTPMTLGKVHRTTSKGLLTIFSDVRDSVLDEQKQNLGLRDRTAELIKENAAEERGRSRKLSAKGLDSGSLVLFRTRLEVLTLSQQWGVPHRLRMSGYGATLPSWLALCFHDFVEQPLSEECFRHLWSERVEGRVDPEWTSDEAWKRLRRIAGNGELVDMNSLRKKLGNGRPPVELAITEYGLDGPTIGTIHASKGREAPNVILHIPFKFSTASVSDDAEEARVLFVGATRAKDTLSVGVGSGVVFHSTKLDSRRACRKGQGKTIIEVGREGDIAPAGLVGKAVMSRDMAVAAQEFLAKSAGQVTAYSLQSDVALESRYALVADSDLMRVGILEPEFTKDLRDALIEHKRGNILAPDLFGNPAAVGAGGASALPGSDSSTPIRSYGCSTLVAPLGGSHELHEPWATSGFLLAPRIAALPSF